MIKIGSHVSMSAPQYYLGSIKEALSYKANALMIFTGPPQNSIRTPLSKLQIEEGWQLLEDAGMQKTDVIIHAPYIINLCNTVKPDTYQWGKDLLKVELQRSEALGANTLVLHPGSHLNQGSEAGIKALVSALDELLEAEYGVTIALETMAGKGAEIGGSFEELRAIIDASAHPEALGVCLDTCHIHDGGYDLSHLDALLEQFDAVIGLDRLKVLHVNDSVNERGAHKDRHANIGYGKIGFDTLYNVVQHPRLTNVIKILEML